MLNAILQDLPDMPPDVVEKWLLPTARRPNFGWPPTLTNEWRFVLGRGNDLAYLKALTWRRHEFALKPTMLRPEDMAMVIGLFQAHVLKQSNLYSQFMSDGAERFRSCCDYLKKHGVFPWPVVLQNFGNVYRVLDGTHRLCAFFYLYGFFKIENEEVPCLEVRELQPFWVAT
jgi:hypothetical protein